MSIIQYLWLLVSGYGYWCFDSLFLVGVIQKGYGYGGLICQLLPFKLILVMEFHVYGSTHVQVFGVFGDLGDYGLTYIIRLMMAFK